MPFLTLVALCPAELSLYLTASVALLLAELDILSEP